MDVIHGYHFDKSSGVASPNGVYYKATSGDKKFFLKQFKEPKYPMEGINPSLYAKKKKTCEEWLAAKKKIIKALNELGNGTGNIVSPREVFREKLSFYQATYWVDVDTFSLDRVRSFKPEDKIMLLKTYSAALKKVHSKDIIHGDLKPDNVLVCKSEIGRPVAKLIDFDDSYFSKQALPPELTVVTDAYQSPELAAYKRGHDEYRDRLTCASDVFASAIIFHQFWFGEMPRYEGREDGKFLYESISAGHGYTLLPGMPAWLENLIHAMLMPLPEDRPTMEEVHAAIVAQKFDRATEEVGEAAEADFSLLDKVWASIPSDLSSFTEESVEQLNGICAKINAVRRGATQEVADKCAKLLYAAIKKLEKKPKKEHVADYSKINKILEIVPKDLSVYTYESASKLRKVISLVKENRSLTSQDEVDRLARILFAALKGLKEDDGATDGFSIVPAAVLPVGYTKVQILSDNKICAYTTTGGRVTLSRIAAIAMKLVVQK